MTSPPRAAPAVPDEAPPQAPGERAPGARTIVTTTIPVALAIAVFGMVYGAAASAEWGAEMAVAVSALVFSGVAQFAALGLAASGAGALAIVLTVLVLNTRNLVLGAALRPRVEGGMARRALLGWFLLDETFGLAMISRARAAQVLLLAGVTCYLAWVGGTILGVLGARVAPLEGLATAVFPVLFVGLAAIVAVGRHVAWRAIAAGLGVAGLAFAIPDPTIHAFLPIVTALIVAVPERRA